MKTKTKANTTDKYQQLNEQLIKLLEQDLPPWRQDWRSQGYGNLFGKPYRGVNPMLCLIDSTTHGYKSPYFVSFNQAKDKGWQVKKGSKATGILFATLVTKVNKEGESEDHYISRWSNVFNLNCIDDSKGETKIADYLAVKEQVNSDKPVADLDQFIEAQSVEIVIGGDRAYYSSSKDQIHMPPFENFSSAIGYYSTVLHELAHATGHSSRMNRPLGNKFGSPEYAFEELVAEIATCMVCQDLKVEYQLENHASYLKSWISRLSEDKNAFVKAMKQAETASNYLMEKPNNA